MIGFVIVALPFLVSQAKPVSVFTPESLGAAYAVLEKPDTATIQAVYPAIRGEVVEREFGGSKLRFVGKPRKVNPALLRRMIENYKNPYRVLEPNCVFHPDHHVVLKRGGHTVETVSCFTCDELLVLADGKFLGRVSMGPPKLLRTIYSSSVPLSDTLRAAAEEWLTRECVSALESASGASVVRTSAQDRPPKELSAWKRASKPTKLDTSFARLLLGALEVHCFNNRLALRFAQPDLPTYQPPAAIVEFGRHALVFHGSYSRAEFYAAGKWVRTIDLFGIENRLQELIVPRIGSR